MMIYNDDDDRDDDDNDDSDDDYDDNDVDYDDGHHHLYLPSSLIDRFLFLSCYPSLHSASWVTPCSY
jgi:hypothetical protein